MASVVSETITPAESDWARGLPLQDPLLARAVADVCDAAFAASGRSDAIERPPRDIQTARRLLQDASDAVIALVEGGEGRDARLLADLRSCTEQVAEAAVTFRLRSTAWVYAALARLRLVVGERELLGAATIELTRCGFDRVIMTRVVGSLGEVAACHDAVAPDWDERLMRYFKQHPLELESLKLESEMVRRHGPVLVEHVKLDAPHLHPVLALTGCRSYVAAPIMPQGKVIGFLHADTHHQRRYVDEFDRDRLWMFAEGFGHVYERRMLLDRIRALRKEVRRANASIVAVMNEYVSTPIELSAALQQDATMAHSAAAMFVSQEARPASLLTRREREVMGLVAAGNTNAQIAAELVLSQQTVRSHVKHILRKLRAVNRAEAVARWTSLGG
ncbi:MAG: LuxR C-terminal-related transcriptional regulator [Solirubrobacteraceae bacterium]